MSRRKKTSDYVRVTLSIPRELWGYFQKQTNSAKHAGNRSSYVRSLILEEMDTLGLGKK